MFSSKKPDLKTRDRKSAAEALANTLPPLLLQAKKLARGFDPGIHGRRKAGVGEDFWQFKHYSIDTPASKIDWRQSAKRDQLYVRQNELETAESVWLWVDNSPNMQYRSEWAENNKLFNAQTLCLALSLLLSGSGENFGLLGISERATSGPVAFERFYQDLIANYAPIMTGTAPVANLPVNRRVVLMSDFLTPLNKLEKLVRSLSQNQCRGVLVHIADPAEVTLPFKGRVKFEAMEDNQSLTIGQTETIQSDYQDLFSNHRSSVRTLARQSSWDYQFIQTDQPEILDGLVTVSRWCLVTAIAALGMKTSFK
ncbi:MAG: DUF58 domain-containing protein, partial [Sneathiella sp.]|nr:DUF58 domain-containing protein [Sneathiella sp.]